MQVEGGRGMRRTAEGGFTDFGFPLITLLLSQKFNIAIEAP